MIKYFCNKCGTEMKSPNMIITAADGKKKTQKHYCEKCSAIIYAYVNSISYSDKSVTQTKEVADEIHAKQVESSTVENEPTQHQKFVASAKSRDDEIIAEFNKSGLAYNPDRESKRVQWFTGENQKAVQFLIDLGASCSLIARMLDIPYVSVHHYFKKNNIDTGTRTPINKESVPYSYVRDEKSNVAKEDYICKPVMHASRVSYKTEENIQKVEKLFNLGFSAKEIAKTTKMPYASAYGIIQGIKCDKSGESFAKDEDGNIKKLKSKEKLVIDGIIIDVPGIIALYNAGWKVTDIASEKGYTTDTVKFAILHKDKYMEE